MYDADFKLENPILYHLNIEKKTQKFYSIALSFMLRKTSWAKSLTQKTVVKCWKILNDFALFFVKC